MKSERQGASDAYRDAGVDIDLAHHLLDRVKKRIAATRRPEALAPIGGFGGLFRIDLTRWRHPVMVTSIDGVGTKLMVAAMMGRHDTVGYDIVHHCINDIAVQGAEPLYFTDYIGIGKLRSPLYEQVLDGLAGACAGQNVTLIGGETAEMPGMYGEDYDLVGCITGIVEEDRIISGEAIEPGDVVLGLASNGLHTNGYSLARRALFTMAGYTVDTILPELDGDSVGEALLRPHTCYWPAIRAALDVELPLHGMAHITGGGLYDNIPRILPDGVGVDIDARSITVPPIFGIIEKSGGIDAYEMYRVFNMGVGMVWFLPEAAAASAAEVLASVGIEGSLIGRVTTGERKVRIEGLDGKGM